ncbi:MAG: Rrf2 family transcriptional regulator [Deltaproteobacteria bacterium]|nr:Rrf2 family transcriptional regulator [Deltaproteobacteria bacterium]
MFRLSKGAEYAIRGILHLSMQPEGKVSFVEEIGEAQDVPKAYLAKIFQSLTKKGFLKSTRGQGGGFTLIKPPAEITVNEVIEAMEGPIYLNDCLVSKDACERETFCPVHELWQKAQTSFMDVIINCTFEELAKAGKVKREKCESKSGAA